MKFPKNVNSNFAFGSFSPQNTFSIKTAALPSSAGEIFTSNTTLEDSNAIPFFSKSYQL